MNAKEKLFFLVNQIDNVRYITPARNNIRIHPTETLNNKFSKLELHGAMQKLANDFGIIDISSAPDPDQSFSLLDEDICFFLKTTPKFQKFKEDLEHDHDYRTFTYGHGGRAQKEASKPSKLSSEKPVANTVSDAPKFNKKYNAIVFMNEIIPIPKNSNQSEMCNVLFSSKKSLNKEWDFDSILEEIDPNSVPSKEDSKKLYRTARAINDHIAKATTIKDFLVVTTTTVAINPNYR